MKANKYLPFGGTTLIVIIVAGLFSRSLTLDDGLKERAIKRFTDPRYLFDYFLIFCVSSFSILVYKWRPTSNAKILVEATERSLGALAIATCIGLDIPNASFWILFILAYMFRKHI